MEAQIQEILSQVFTDPRIIAILTAILTWIAGNIVTIICFAIKNVKLKVAESKEKMLHESVIEELTRQYTTSIERLERNMTNKLTELEEHFQAKVDRSEFERKQEIEAETLDLENTIALVKTSLLKED